MNWDPRSGQRERLYLLTRIGSADPSGWTYNPHADVWRGPAGQRITVGCEGQESLAVLAARGLAITAALDLVKS